VITDLFATAAAVSKYRFVYDQVPDLEWGFAVAIRHSTAQDRLAFWAEEDLKITLKELAADIDVTRAQLNRWISDSNNEFSGSNYATRVINCFLERYGNEAIQLYDYLGWTRPIVPHQTVNSINLIHNFNIVDCAQVHVSVFST
jgi:hypothetical protein